MRDSRVFQNALHAEVGEVVDVPGHNLHEKVKGTTHRVTLDNVRLISHTLMKRIVCLMWLSLHANADIRGHLQTELTLVEQRDIFSNRACRFKQFHAPEGGRLRQANNIRQLHVGHAPIGLQRGEYLFLDPVDDISLF